MMMCIALRFIPTLIEETDKIMSAQKARGADFESGNLLQRAKALIPILVPLFIIGLPPGRRAGHGHGVPLLPWRRGPHEAPSSSTMRRRDYTAYCLGAADACGRDCAAALWLVIYHTGGTLCRNIALTLRYLGTAYHGWQVQKNDITVGQTLEKAAAMVVGHKVHITGCGRTDAGVHAKVYVANFRTDARIPVDRIAIRLQHAPARRHRRHRRNGGARRLQCHRLVRAGRNTPISSTIPAIQDPFYVNRAWFYPKHLDEAVMQQRGAAVCRHARFCRRPLGRNGSEVHGAHGLSLRGRARRRSHFPSRLRQRLFI